MPKRKQLPSFPVVGIGASAGGLEACARLLDALPADSGMAFILVQHLDPTHESLMVELLAKHTKMPVVQATEDMLIAANHVFIIAPGTYLAARGGVLRVSAPLARHGARLPFDFLLESLADSYGARAIGIVLSGTGADGSIGLKAVKAKHGLIIAQDPDEADYGGMPRSAIESKLVDLVLPVAEMAEALIDHVRRPPKAHRAPDGLSDIIELLRSATAHDFTLYKMGTLQRRIERRMALAGLKHDAMATYLTQLRGDHAELDLLAKDLLINVTRFFRDTKVFELLESKIIPDIIMAQPGDQPLRIWVAGCSTGEEAYSLTMLFREAIVAAKSNIKLQVFASDVDGDAVTQARNGLYPHTINADVSPERLARFFTREEQGYRVSPELRTAVVFTVQDVLADPPFSRLDLVSCRNLLIYLGPEAQAKVITLFNFALRKGGILLLGNAETISHLEASFDVISKNERLYRKVGSGRHLKDGFALNTAESPLAQAPDVKLSALARQVEIAALCQKMVLETHAPATVLINRKHEWLYSLGPIDRYLRIAAGHPSHDLFDMAPPTLRTRLRAVMSQVSPDAPVLVAAGGRHDGIPFNIDIRSVPYHGEELLLLSFVDAQATTAKRAAPASAKADNPRVRDLEQELEATRTELQGAIHSLEKSGEEQRAINEEAMSVNEEFQSTNEELLTSKEELQSLNEELTALNSQLQETLERQRTTSNDLQNVLYSTDVATLFLDSQLNIRFFTPATKVLFNVIRSDIGRPLADLHSLATDSSLSVDARAVLDHLTPIDAEIETQGGVWFMRRITPYLANDEAVEGVVITFTNITERKHAARLLDDAKKEAELATVAKSRFLAVASHDLRQPLQTLALLQGLLSKKVQDEKGKMLVARLDETLGAMTGMLNTLLDINQIESGVVKPEMTRFPINTLLDQLRSEFSYHAQAKKLQLRVVGCSLEIESDRRLLEQMLRNLISNALKYTQKGKILLGCRRRAGTVSIETIDTGIGIADAELKAIFDEYHQVDNAARERSLGLGLGLSIVQRLSILLGHQVEVRSVLGKGSQFSVEVSRGIGVAAAPAMDTEPHLPIVAHAGTILIVEDDPEVRALLQLLLEGEGHVIHSADDGVAALKLVADGSFKPDLVLTDYNLPHDMDGLQVARKLRDILGATLPVIVLTGDISTETMRDVAGHGCVQLNKPVKMTELMAAIHKLLLPAA